MQNMTFAKLQKLNRQNLSDYVWRRLRLEPPINPPLRNRFGEEPPEQFIFEAVKNSQEESFRRPVLDAIQDNLSKLALQAVSAEPDIFWRNRQTDQHIASLAFLISMLKASELVPTLEFFSLPWLSLWRIRPNEITDGQFHLLRTLAQLQQGKALAGMWEDLWEHGPRSLRGLIFFGWARADSLQALRQLGELADSADPIDLPATLWSLIGPEGPGIRELSLNASRCNGMQQSKLRQALVDVGVDQQTLREFDLNSQFAVSVFDIIERLPSEILSLVELKVVPYLPNQPLPQSSQTFGRLSAKDAEKWKSVAEAFDEIVKASGLNFDEAVAKSREALAAEIAVADEDAS
jgi:hypothetical protein